MVPKVCADKILLDKFLVAIPLISITLRTHQDMVDADLQSDSTTATFKPISYDKVSDIPVRSINSELTSKFIHLERRIPSSSVFDIDDKTFRSAMPRASHWSIAWSDLMMTMFVLFLSMFVYQTAHQEFLKPGKPEIIGGDTTEALQVLNSDRATLPFDPTIRGLPLITAGTIRKAEPVPTSKDKNVSVKKRDENILGQVDKQEKINPIIKRKSHTSKKKIATRKIVEEPAPLTPINPTAREENFQEIYRMSKTALRSNNLNKFAAIDLVPDKTMRIILTGDLLFDTGQSELSESAKRSLRQVTGFIKNTPYMINIVGHTDNVPMGSSRYGSNWELSVDRATRVARFLIDQIGMNPNQFVVSGYSSYRPLVANTTAENRSKNRRVEIIVSKRLPNPSPLNSRTIDK